MESGLDFYKLIKIIFLCNMCFEKQSNYAKYLVISGINRLFAQHFSIEGDAFFPPSIKFFLTNFSYFFCFHRCGHIWFRDLKALLNSRPQCSYVALWWADGKDDQLHFESTEMLGGLQNSLPGSN